MFNYAVTHLPAICPAFWSDWYFTFPSF